MLLTGSRALNYWLHKESDPKSDWDYIASEDELNKMGLSFGGKSSRRHMTADKNIEYLDSGFLKNNAFNGVETEIGRVCTLQELYIQKRSHIWRPLKFQKHIRYLETIKTLLKQKGEEIPGLSDPILQDRIRLTKAAFKDRVPSLNKTNEDFFDDFVTKAFEHDDIHRIVAYYDEPIFERLKRDSSLAKCERDLWKQLSHEDKVKCVQEECYVIALERKIIPDFLLDKPHMSGKIAFSYSQERVSTTLTSGFFRDFAIDNWKEINSTTKDFVKDFKEAYKNGKICRIDQIYTVS